MTDPVGDIAASRRVRPRALVEIGLVIALFGLYKVGRAIALGHDALATRNGAEVWRIERWLGLPSELDLQNVLLQSVMLVKIANSYYAFVHFPATAAFLIFLYWKRPDRYLTARRSLALLTGAALLVHLTYPLAPPRLVPHLGMIDLAARFGPAVYSSSGAQTAVNQFAAMPSLHAGWALLIAIELIRGTRGWWRWLIIVHPLITVAVIVATANHYWLDVAVAWALLGAAMGVSHVYGERMAYRIRRSSARLMPVPLTTVPVMTAGRTAAPARTGAPVAERPIPHRMTLATGEWAASGLSVHGDDGRSTSTRT